MSEILQANLFFLITSAAVIVFTLFMCVAVIYVIQILRSINRITRRLEEGVEVIGEDVAAAHKKLAQKGLLKGIFGVILSGVAAYQAQKNREKEDDTDDEK